MSCDCVKKTHSDLEKTRELVEKEMKIDKKDFVIFKIGGKIYHERKECWIKAGRPGEILEIRYYQ